MEVVKSADHHQIKSPTTKSEDRLSVQNNQVLFLQKDISTKLLEGGASFSYFCNKFFYSKYFMKLQQKWEMFRERERESKAIN